MRTKRNQRIPQNLEDYVHSINIVKSKNKNNASNNSGNTNVNLSKNCHDKRVNEEYSVNSIRVVDEGNKLMREGDRKVNGNDGFVGNLNGSQFPPINGMVATMNDENKGHKDCLGSVDHCDNGGANTNSDDCVETGHDDNVNVQSNNVIGPEVNDQNKELATRVNVSSQKDGTSGTESAFKNAGVKLVDIVNSTRLDNKLMNVPTAVSENRNNVVIFDDELIELGSKKWRWESEWNDGFVSNLNGSQFPPNNGMVGTMNDENKGHKDCLGSVDYYDNGGTNTNSDDCVETWHDDNVNVQSKNVIGPEVNDHNEELATRVNVSSQKDRTSGTESAFKNAGVKLVDIVNSTRLDNKLMNVPTAVSENRNNVVIFDDKLIELGSKKWNLIVYRQFIGCSIEFNEAWYHIRRMWNRLKLIDVITENGVF
ncbi:hypothetical protein Tco_0491203 [Tanacetum coccineum]